jgi:hypothetical protein
LLKGHLVYRIIWSEIERIEASFGPGKSYVLQFAISIWLKGVPCRKMLVSGPPCCNRLCFQAGASSAANGFAAGEHRRGDAVARPSGQSETGLVKM